jgi:DNA polymerase III epsilon subunit family exonuclease
MSYVVVDIETTGLSKSHHRITEIAAAVVDNKGSIRKEFQTLINPGVKIPGFITRLTGIDDDMVKDAPTISQVMPAVIKVLGNNTFVAHNASFDFGFLDYNAAYYFRKRIGNERLCTRKLANRLCPRLPSKKLSALCDYFNITNTDAHRAMSDVYATVEVLNRFIDILKDSGITKKEDILRFESLPAKKCFSLLC